MLGGVGSKGLGCVGTGTLPGRLGHVHGRPAYAAKGHGGSERLGCAGTCYCCGGG